MEATPVMPRILVLYNESATVIKGESREMLAEQAVVACAQAVAEALAERFVVRCVPIQLTLR